MTVYFFDSLCDSLSGKHAWIVVDGSGRVKLRERPVQERWRREMARGKRGYAKGGTPQLSITFADLDSAIAMLKWNLLRKQIDEIRLFKNYLHKQK
jgi:hypothetical protein